MTSKEKEFDKFINDLTKDNSNINKRIIQNDCGEICILFIKQITDRIMLSNYIIKPIIEYCSSSKTNAGIEQLLNKAILADDCQIENGYGKVHENLLNGHTVILLSWESQFIIANIKKVEKKAISGPELTYTLRGPRDSFTENLDVNLSLIRYRIKDPNLKINMCKVGIRTNTKVAVIYIEDISNKSYVDDIIKRINSIETDGINESGELQAFLLNNSLNLFPQMGLVERSDSACGALLEGKVVVITEGSGIALVAPKVFGEFLQSCDDIYDNKYMGTFSKVIRFLSLNITYSLTPLYVAIVSFHNDILPGEYIITLATTRASVPFNAFTEALIVEFVTEALREALIRVPKQIGPAIGIVGAIIIGQAAIAAGIFSPLILIISSLSLLTSFVVPDYTIINPFRILKFLMLFVTGVFGLLGFTMGVCFIVTNIISSNSFSIPYFAPTAPFNLRDFVKSIFYSKSLSTRRPNFLKTKDKTRK
jgi:spore germination protein KA